MYIAFGNLTDHSHISLHDGICRLGTSDNLLLSIQEKIKWADTMNELDKKHRKDIEDKVEEVKKSLSQKVS